MKQQQGRSSIHTSTSAENPIVQTQSTVGDPKLELNVNYSEQEEPGFLHSSNSVDTADLKDDVPKTKHNHQTDPFAVREGRTLTWRNVNMTLRASGKRPERHLLRDCWGEVPKRQLTAIMGASGAGKTSLLNILAGRLRTTPKLIVQADVRLNNYAVDPTNIHVRQFIAFVAQDDSLPITATPYEAIRFSAKLRLPRTTTDAELDELTHRMLTELGLLACKDTLVGGLLIKGISGGERKRTSVGVELVTKPSMVFLDEPTSGLDSFSAEQCCEVLKKVACSGASVMFTIHQPNSEIFDTFDHLILLNKGRVMYQGAITDIPEFFASRGQPVPRNYNPADWVIDVAQELPMEELEAAGFFPLDERKMAEAFSTDEQGRDAIGQTLRSSIAEDTMLLEPPPGGRVQINQLFRRELVSLRRDWTVPFARIFMTAFLGAFIGTIFLDVGNVDKSDRFALQSLFGALMIILITTMLSSMQLCLFTFPDERPVFLREYSTKHYGVSSYVVSHMTTELAVLAGQTAIMLTFIYFMVGFSGRFYIIYLVAYTLAMVSTAVAVFAASLAGANSKLAMQLTPLLFAPQLLFSGYFVSPSLMPPWLRWLQMVCPLTYAARILVVEEFHECSDVVVELENCEDIVESSHADPDEVWWYWLALVALFVVFRTLSLLVMQRSALKFY